MRRGEAFGRALERDVSRGPGAVVDFAALAPFVWDRCLVVAAYGSRDAAGRALGLRWRDSARTATPDNDAFVLVIFALGDSVIAWHDQPRRPDLAGVARGAPYRRAEARFRVDSAPGNGPGWMRLRPVE